MSKAAICARLLVCLASLLSTQRGLGYASIHKRAPSKFLAEVQFAQQVAAKIVSPCAQAIAAKVPHGRERDALCSSAGLFSDSLKEAVGKFMQCASYKAGTHKEDATRIVKGILYMAEDTLCKMEPHQPAVNLWRHLQEPGNIFDWAIRAVVRRYNDHQFGGKCSVPRVGKRDRDLQRNVRVAPAFGDIQQWFIGTELSGKVELVGGVYRSAISGVVVQVQPGHWGPGRGRPPLFAMKFAECSDAHAEYERLHEILSKANDNLLPFLPRLLAVTGNVGAHGVWYRYFTMTLAGPDIAKLWNDQKITADQLKRIIFLTYHFIVALHRHGFSHGDLHPGNIAVNRTDQSQLVVLEFGRAHTELELANGDYCRSIVSLIETGQHRFQGFTHAAPGLSSEVRAAARCPKAGVGYAPVRDRKDLEDIARRVGNSLDSWLGEDFAELNKGQRLTDWKPPKPTLFMG